MKQDQKRKIGVVFPFLVIFIAIVGYDFFVWLTGPYELLSGHWFRVAAALDALSEFAVAESYFVFISFIAGTFFYWVRCRILVAYALLEIAVGICIVSYVAFRLRVPFERPHITLYTGNALGMTGAMYIIVRGYDNFYKSLKAGTRLVLWWNSEFFGKDTPDKL